MRGTVLLGLAHAPAEGGVMMVRSRDKTYRMKDVKGKKIGLSKSLNTIKWDWRRTSPVKHVQRLPGIGAWTSAETARLALGDPDAVSVGDYHLPNLVAWALAGEPRAGDARMLDLLEPYRGQRGRVQRLLEASGLRPPVFGPRMEARSISRW